MQKAKASAKLLFLCCTDCLPLSHKRSNNRIEHSVTRNAILPRVHLGVLCRSEHLARISHRTRGGWVCYVLLAPSSPTCRKSKTVEVHRAHGDPTVGIIATTSTSNESEHTHHKSSLSFTQHQLHLGRLLVPVVRATFAQGQVKELAQIGRVVRLSDGVEWVAH